MTYRKSVASLAVGLLCCFVASTARGVLLSDLIDNNGSIQCDDKIFSMFTYHETGDNPDDDFVNVICITDSQGNPGLRFQGAFADLPANGGSDALITFKVTVDPDSSQLISDVHLTFNGVISGSSGFVGVTETFLPTDPNVVLNVFNQQPGPFQLTDFSLLTTPVRELHVQKDIILFAGPESAATASFVDQTFSQVPEPTPALLVLLGSALCAMGVRRKS